MRKGYRFTNRTDQRTAALVQQLDPPVPFTLEGLRIRLEQYCHRPVRMISTAMPPGGPSGVWIRTDSTDYLYYEDRTSAFHQAHIVTSLAAHILLTGAAGGRISQQLLPNLDPQAGQMLSATAIGDTVSSAEAELFAFECLRRGGLFPGPLRARHLLKRLQPLHSVLLAAVPSAACPTGPGSPAGATARLYRTVIEMRDAALVLGPNDTPDRAAAASSQGLVREAHDQTMKTATEAAVLIHELDIELRRSRQDGRAGASAAITCSADLRLEASRLAQASRTFRAPRSHTTQYES